MIAILAAMTLAGGEITFTARAPGEAVATVVARCVPCAWGRRGREAAVLRISLDGRYAQHLILTRGAEKAAYEVLLGPVAAGEHRLSLEHDRGASARSAGAPEIERVEVRVIEAGAPEHDALAHAPWIELRKDALSRFTDVPLVAWSETETVAGGGRRIRYSIVFSNEDGGTPPDRLLATWGRLTDIEYAYGIEWDANGRMVREEYQGRDHRILPFRGRRHGRHPLLSVVTRNNMLAEGGGGRRRVALVPAPLDLTATSREAAMDAHPWTYAVSTAEVRREGRVRDAAPAGRGLIPDPRSYVQLEACAETQDAALTFAVATRAAAGVVAWHESDRGQPRYRIERSADHFPNGCFRGAVPLPPGLSQADVIALRFRAYTRATGKGEPKVPPGAARARLRRVNRLFRLDDRDQPGPDLFTWTGDLVLPMDGRPVEMAIAGGRR